MEDWYLTGTTCFKSAHAAEIHSKNFGDRPHILKGDWIAWLSKFPRRDGQAPFYVKEDEVVRNGN